MKLKSTLVCLSVLLSTVALTACVSKSEPSSVVTSFLEALITNDEERLFNVVCPEWETEAALEYDAFSGITGTLEGAACKTSGINGSFTLIICTGKMILDYNGELRERSLENDTYRVKRTDGEWKMCGYQ